MLNIIPTLYEGYVVSVHRMVMENRPVDPEHPGESPTYTYILHDKTEHARTIVCVKLSINNHIVRLVHKKHIIRTCLMYHAACKVDFQPFKQRGRLDVRKSGVCGAGLNRNME